MQHTAETAATIAINQAEEIFAHLQPDEKIRAHALAMKHHQSKVAVIETKQSSINPADTSTLI